MDNCPDGLRVDHNASCCVPDHITSYQCLWSEDEEPRSEVMGIFSVFVRLNCLTLEVFPSAPNQNFENYKIYYVSQPSIFK